MSEKRFRKMMEAREEEKCCNKGYRPPSEVLAIFFIALNAIVWLGAIGVKKAGGKLPWE